MVGNTDLSVKGMEQLRVQEVTWATDSDAESQANCKKKKE